MQQPFTVNGIGLQAGDVFAVDTGTFFGNLINAVQTFWAVDNRSEYKHAGIVASQDGRTFEALARIRYADLRDYAGRKVLIARHVHMSPELFALGFNEVRHLDGAVYPFPRLFLHLVKLAKYIHWRYPVCSELVGKFECGAGLRENWWGLMPDNLADQWRESRYYVTVYEGILPDVAPAREGGMT